MASNRASKIIENLEAGLKGAKFRILNEVLYRKTDKEMNPELFQKYHEGYREQVAKWPFNPVDRIVNQLRNVDAKHVIADMGCGDATIAKRFKERQVHSFDLIKPEDDKYVVEADIRNTPLKNESVEVVVFCLSLMGEDASAYIEEAYRILKPGALLKIVEVRSRLHKIDGFVRPMSLHGFTLLSKDLESNFFCFFDFKKVSTRVKRLPSIPLKPCVYKKR
ncbi:ribosomal RNA-processing protein 8 [Nematocida major]|uniref:ribosomal RNA-processing protein 8 n=1 Tax=Nematocida major TaxID=1912982 RepID=UPI0020087ACC|nr:ribosomal RNA-processing protein 8 [Nematocida major]KAH9386454.1 ribosomal RNA-processing protein 8 [Nematocida major]